jgi:hypothetical protein
MTLFPLLATLPLAAIGLRAALDRAGRLDWAVALIPCLVLIARFDGAERLNFGGPVLGVDGQMQADWLTRRCRMQGWRIVIRSPEEAVNQANVLRVYGHPDRVDYEGHYDPERPRAGKFIYLTDPPGLEGVWPHGYLFGLPYYQMKRMPRAG